MTTVFRTTALAAALAAFSCGALAAPVTIKLNFEVEGAKALDLGEPVAVSNVPGFKFEGAWAYEYDMLSDKDIKPGDDSNSGGFIINRARNFDTKIIALSLDQSAAGYPGQYFQSISFQAYTTSSAMPTLTAFDAKGLSWLVTELTAGDGFKLWSPTPDYAIGDQKQAVRLEFKTDGGILGLDDLSITLTEASTGGGGDVPEPASYALVGLALFAAASASRRRS